MARSDLPARVADAWDRQWPGTLPVGYLLRGRHADRWVRFHSLPGSKRYADTESEYAVILGRHNTVLTELGAGELTVITAQWSERPERPARRRSVLARLDPPAVYWRAVEAEADLYWHLFVSQRPWVVGAVDALLRAVADDELVNVILGPGDLQWLYHPYDGGADVILPTTGERDALRDRHRDWLSTHPSGM